ncbi:MAG: 4'-phosphopantetheinyl transferase superfamily protein [Deltaproteobacteria bacterium]|nr:4'-phosphopantetheinyl transferase superfamily protein [Deltaproteobacteria bacterium]
MSAAPRWLTRLAPHVPPGDAWLAPEEQAVQAGLRFPPRRASWRLGRWTAKQAVLHFLARPDDRPERVAILAAPDGAPEPHLDGAPLPLCLSITHRDDRAVAALCALPGRLGCDLEAVAHREPSFAATYLTDDEQAWATGPEEDLRVTLAWSAKESALKHARTGLRRDTRSVVVEADTRGPGPWRRGALLDLERDLTLTLWWRGLDGGVLTVATDPDAPPPEPLDAATAAT